MTKYNPIQNAKLPNAEQVRPPSNKATIIGIIIFAACVLFLWTHSNIQSIWDGVWVFGSTIVGMCAMGIFAGHFSQRRIYLLTLSKSANIDNIHQSLKTKHILQVHDVKDPIADAYGIIDHGGGHSIKCIVWEPEGEKFAIGSTDKSICIYDIANWKFMVMEGHTDWINSLAWSPNGKILASASSDKTIRLWDLQSGTVWKKLTADAKSVQKVVWSPDGRWLASASEDRKIRIWDVEKGEGTTIFYSVRSTIALAWSPDGRFLAISDGEDILRWDMYTQVWDHNIRSKHSGYVTSLTWSPDNTLLLSGATDKTIVVWNIATGRASRTLEGHVNTICALSFIYDGKLLVSRSQDGILQFRETKHWQLLVTANYEEGDFVNGAGFAFNPAATLLAMPVVGGHALRIWDVEPEAILNTQPAVPLVRYTNAKVVLVGDYGVGKTGLSLALAGEQFAPTESTHGRHIYTLASTEVERAPGHTELREVLLWDLAGQPNYRVIHQLHLDEVAVAVVLFDSKSETDPFGGVRYWNRALQQSRSIIGNSALPLTKFLVAGRCDRGAIGVSQERVQAFVREMHFHGYFATSAKSGENIRELALAIKEAIDWDSLPIIESTELFTRIKEFLLSQKQAAIQLISLQDLYRSYQQTQTPAERLEDQMLEFKTCIGRLEAVGLIQRLSFGDIILLQPELLDSYASGLINTVKNEPEGLGYISIERIYKGMFKIPDEDRIQDPVRTL